MDFKHINKEDLKFSPSYIISTTILNMKDDFTFDDVIKKVVCQLGGMYSSSYLKTKVADKLNFFRDNFILIEHGATPTYRKSHNVGGSYVTQ